MQLKCLVCDKSFPNKIGLSIHITQIHHIKTEQYTLKYLYNNIIPICSYKNCNNHVKYSSFSYNKYCHINHRNLKENHVDLLKEKTKKTLENKNKFKVVSIEKNKKEFRKNKIIIQCNTCKHLQSKTIKTIRSKFSCTKCNKLSSNLCEEKIKKVLQSLLKNKKILLRDKNVITPKEIDVYVPFYKFGIEYHGVYWHCNKFTDDYYKHQKKYEICVEKGITLYQFFSDEWDYREDICINLIKNHLLLNNNISYQSCVVKKDSYKNINKFINENSLENLRTKKDISYCFYYKKKLISICLLDNITGFIKQIVHKKGFYVKNILSYFFDILKLNKIQLIIDKRIDDRHVYEGFMKNKIKDIEPKIYGVTKNKCRDINNEKYKYKIWDAGHYLCEIFR